MSIIGMTTCPEAFLAREAEICYTVMAHVTDYDVWHTSESPVTVEKVIETLNRNTQIAQQAVAWLVRDFKEQRDCDCGSALSKALITDPHVVPEQTRRKLHLLVDKYMQ
jgi:5'-methylthioadenosine phosphorylase